MEEGNAMKLKTIPWSNNENNTYTMKIRQEDGRIKNIGSMELRIEHNDTTTKFISNINIDSIKYNEMNITEADNETLEPSNSCIEWHSDNIGAKLTVSYKRRHVLLVANTGTDEHSKKVPFTGSIFDSMQLLFVIRCLDFAETDVFNIEVLSGVIGTISEVVVRYIGEEVFEKDNEQIKCIRISLESSIEQKSRQFLLYSACEKRELIRWTRGNQCIELD